MQLGREELWESGRQREREKEGGKKERRESGGFHDPGGAVREPLDPRSSLCMEQSGSTGEAYVWPPPSPFLCPSLAS